MNRNYRRRLAVTSVLAIAISGGVWIGRSDAGGGTGPKTYSAVATQPSLCAGEQTAGIKFTNTSKNNISFAAVNILVPSGLTVTAPSIDTPGTAELSADQTTIQLRSLNVPRLASFTVTFTVTPGLVAPPDTTVFAFVPDVRQSNDFNGTNNKFAPDLADPTMSGPCSHSSVKCVAGDDEDCTTGIITSKNGNTAFVTVNDGDAITATLTASLAAGAIDCAEYTETSDQLKFDIDVESGDLTDVTKTATLTQHYSGTKAAWEYQACFQAPADFPALLPSQLPHDFATGDFSGNTTQNPPGTFTGLLLPCSAGYGSPCLVGTSIDAAASTVSMTIEVPVGDPLTRY